jgi:hypothetical protein
MRPHRGFLDRRKSFKNRLQIAFYVVCLRGLFKCFAPVGGYPLARPPGAELFTIEFVGKQYHLAKKALQGEG